MRNGDFYRSLNDDAQKLSDTLRIPIQKPKAKGEGELMAEFPHHALDVYLPRLIRAGNRVAIADMQEPSKKQTTNKTKNQTQTDTMEKKTEKKKTKTKEAKVDKTEVKAETKKNDKAVEQSADTKVHKPREPQMVTVNGEKRDPRPCLPKQPGSEQVVFYRTYRRTAAPSAAHEAGGCRCLSEEGDNG